MFLYSKDSNSINTVTMHFLKGKRRKAIGLTQFDVVNVSEISKSSNGSNFVFSTFSRYRLTNYNG